MEDNQDKFTILKGIVLTIAVGIFIFASMSGIMFLTSKDWKLTPPKQEINHNNYAEHRNGVA